MQFRIIAVSVTLASVGFIQVGCKQDPADTETSSQPETQGAIAELSVEQVETLIQSKRPPTVFDANSAKTRDKFGTVPGARLLSSSSQYEPAKVLPQDKGEKLVFYCGSETCAAAKGAAKRASTAGWKDVNVMPAGIKGWSAAGKPTNQS